MKVYAGGLNELSLKSGFISYGTTSSFDCTDILCREVSYRHISGDHSRNQLAETCVTALDLIK